MSYKKILDYLYSLDSPNIKLGLESIRKLLEDIGNPEKGLKCIHVAGTNGKGSVCAMLFYILREAGYKVGLYTSPHLKRFNERIRVNEHLISDREIAEYFLKIKPLIDGQSFFEITTAMAFLYFRENNVDYAILETGLGGRLDATNVVAPLISVITNIELEHTDVLGDTIEKIAFEKAGIIKEGIPVVTGASGKSLKVIKKAAKDKNAPLYLAKKSGGAAFFCPVRFLYLGGKFQQENAKIALASIGALKNFYSLRIKIFHIKNGIKKTRWPGRLEFILENVLIDCAHNPAGFETLKKEIISIIKGKNFKEIFFVIGTQKTKDIAAMLQKINPLISKAIFTKSKNENAAEPEDLLKAYKKINPQKNFLKKSFFAKAIISPKKALEYARKMAGPRDLVVVTGSIYMVGEVI